MTQVRRISGGGPYEAAIGYSRAVVLPVGSSTGRVLVSGCTATVGGVVVHPGDAFNQALIAWDVVQQALRAAGSDLDQVVRTRMYVVGRENCEAVGRAHAVRLSIARPAATMVLVAGLIDPAMLVEVEAEALLHPARG